MGESIVINMSFKHYMYGIIRMLLSFFAIVCLKLHNGISDFVL